MRLVIMVGIAVLVALTSGCSTLTKGTSQTVTVNTDPPGAVCALTRDGKSLAVVNPTPGSVSISKSSAAISVDCKKDKYVDAAGTMASEFQAMTFGNVLFGGLIGVAIDAASGATHEYPPIVTITLTPNEFATIADRDTFFERMQTNLLRESAAVKERIAKECSNRERVSSPGGQTAAGAVPPQCERELAAADAGTQSKQAQIEQQRLLAKVAGQ